MLSPEVLSRLALLAASFVALTLGYRPRCGKFIGLFIRRAKAWKGLLTIPAVILPLRSRSGGVLTFYVYHGFGHQPDIYRRGSCDSNMVAITFDDGPSREFTPAILDILKEYDVPATFFMVGSACGEIP